MRGLTTIYDQLRILNLHNYHDNLIDRSHFSTQLANLVIFWVKNWPTQWTFINTFLAKVNLIMFKIENIWCRFWTVHYLKIGTNMKKKCFFKCELNRSIPFFNPISKLSNILAEKLTKAMDIYQHFCAKVSLIMFKIKNGSCRFCLQFRIISTIIWENLLFILLKTV